MTEITLKVPQGIGDIWLVHRKVAKHVDRVNYIILGTSNTPFQKRSIDWLKLFPKCGAVDFKVVDESTYAQLASGMFDIEKVLNDAESEPQFYSVNKPLEQGIRLEDIDPMMEVDWDVSPRRDEVEDKHDYVVLYVSGAAHHPAKHRNGAWGVPLWAKAINYCLNTLRLDPLPIYLIGAEWDKGVMSDLKMLLKKDITAAVGTSPMSVMGLISRARMFIGFQSGLGILADAFDTFQLMMYYDYMKPMKYTWCKPENGQRKFFAATFCDMPNGVVKLFKQ